LYKKPVDQEKLASIGKNLLMWVQNYWLQALLVFLFIFYVLPLLVKIARVINLHRISKHLVYLKIELPRSDSKIDQEKRTEKDFKEKVAIMSQLYRAIYEIRELDLWTKIKTRIWQADNISFELFIEKQRLSFYVVANQQYKKCGKSETLPEHPPHRMWSLRHKE